jgi:uncharacterized protein
MTPAVPGERIEQLDVLRGVAVLGILMVNAPSFAAPWFVREIPTASPEQFTGASPVVWWIVRTFFEQKFVTLFSMLFGVSLFLVGGEFGDRARTAVLVRRLLWLALFGLIHGVAIWWGDILLLYALAGGVMLFCRSWPARLLLPAGGVLVAIAAFIATQEALGSLRSFGEGEGGEVFSRMVADTIAGFRGDLAFVQEWNFAVWTFGVRQAWRDFAPLVLGLMMIGLGLFKRGVLQGRASARTYQVLLLLGALALAVIGWTAAAELRAGFPLRTLGLWSLPNFLLSLVVTLGYVAAVSLALRTRAARPAAWLFGAVGRMAFTNYIAQSLIMTAVFYGGGRGLGFFGQLTWTEWTLVVLAVWAAQLVWSPLWLARFRMGPLEWLWRSLSYNRRVQLRRNRALERPSVPAP